MWTMAGLTVSARLLKFSGIIGTGAFGLAFAISNPDTTRSPVISIMMIDRVKLIVRVMSLVLLAIGLLSTRCSFEPLKNGSLPPTVCCVVRFVFDW